MGSIVVSLLLISEVPKITMKAEMAEKSVGVSYDDVDMDMLWPGYYYNKRQANTIPLSELVELFVPKVESSEKQQLLLILCFLGVWKMGLWILV